MKNLLTILLLFIGFVSYGQTTPLTTLYNFVIESGQVQHIKVYEVANTPEKQLSDKLYTHLSTVAGIKELVIKDNSITGDINNLTVDYKKYGGTWGNTITLLRAPMEGKFIIQIKDNKYRVISSDLGFGANGKLKDFFTRNKGTEFVSRQGLQDALKYIDGHLSDMFNVGKNLLKADF